ncbi:MAG: serine/threonine protein kinase [Deltaproteobacteria bacterium]|nr:serine/threonine protein kinase [Deltaproteobacteria bacterium]
MIGETVGSYRITAKISTGGMGTVYKAEHTLIGKHAAVKVLHPELCHNEELVNRFFNEAKATTQIKHPGIVEIFDFGYMESGDAFIVMEFLEGASLARRLKQKGKLDEGEAAMLLRGVCNALAAAHGKKIVHRDLKPDNLMLCPDPEAPTGERCKILDFGIAKLTDTGMMAGAANMTKTGSVMGTPTYMSPEQCRGNGQLDERSDLYSLGCIYYEMIAGRPPFDNMSAGELIGAHLFIEPVPPINIAPHISADANALIMELLAKDPAKRPQSARELGLRFAEIAKNHGWISHTNPTSVRAPEGPPRDDDPHDETLASAPRITPPAVARVTPPPDSSPMTTDPTTLSGAASQSVHDVPKRRVGLYAGIAAAAVVLGAVTFIAVKGGDKSKRPPAVEPATAPAATAPTPTPAVTTPPPVDVAKPAPAAVPVTPPTPATPPTPPPDPVEVAKPTPAPPVTPPETHKPVAVTPKVTKPATTKPATPATTKPATTAATKPDTHKPTTTKPDAHKPGNGSGSGKILIETDL